MGAPTQVVFCASHADETNGPVAVQFRGEYRGEMSVSIGRDKAKVMLPAINIQFELGGVTYSCPSTELTAAITAAVKRAYDDYKNAVAEPIPA